MVLPSVGAVNGVCRVCFRSCSRWLQSLRPCFNRLLTRVRGVYPNRAWPLSGRGYEVEAGLDARSDGARGFSGINVDDDL